MSSYFRRGCDSPSTCNLNRASIFSSTCMSLSTMNFGTKMQCFYQQQAMLYQSPSPLWEKGN